MKNCVLKIIFVCLILSFAGILEGYSAVRYHCPADSLKAMQLVEAAAKGENYGERIVMAAKAMEGTPLGKAADNDSIGTIVVRLDTLNRREFIYLALAAAKTAILSSPTLKDFENNLADVSRRKGKDEGFASQFLYASDWIVDNVYRDNLKEMTEYLEGGNNRTKTLDYVSRHPEEFPAMADSVTAEKVKLVEFGYRSHRIPHLKKQSINNKALKEIIKNGDIIILNPPETDFDIFDIGIVTLKDGEPYLIHFSREKEEVATDPYPLSRLFKNEGQFFYGFRWIRPVE